MRWLFATKTAQWMIKQVAENVLRERGLIQGALTFADLRKCDVCGLVGTKSDMVSQTNQYLYYAFGTYTTWKCSKCGATELEAQRLSEWAKQHPEAAKVCKEKWDRLYNRTTK